MKEYIIGRGNDSDIVIPDESDQVSRKHCMLRVHFWGKMFLNDESSNGTYINGGKVESKTWLRVSRKDAISLGNVWDFDWNMVPRPYRIAKIILSVLLVLVLAGGGAAGYIFRDDIAGLFREKNIKKVDFDEENTTAKTDSTAVDSTVVDSAAAVTATNTNSTKPGRKSVKKSGSKKNVKVKIKPETEKPESKTDDRRMRAGEVIF